MKINLTAAEDLGPILRAVRKAQRLRQDDAAGSIGVSENFLGKAESGSGSVQWGKLFAALHALGIRLELDLPVDLPPPPSARKPPKAPRPRRGPRG